jgi:predicted ATPase
MGLPFFLGLLGEAYAKVGESRRALAQIDDALASARRNGARFQFSELLRLKAEIVVQMSGADGAEIEALLRSAIRSANRQGAAMPELRAATALARRLSDWKRHSEARDLLRPYSGLIAQARDSLDARAAADLL